jgi:hypothetical protein
MQDGLVLRDVHRPPAPSLWPPAPGWWIVIAALLLIAVLWWWLRGRRMRRRSAALEMFDAATATAPTPAAALAAASELLRRSARGIRADADRLDGDAWLEFLDTPRARFTEGPGRLLLDGAFRPVLDEADVEAAMRLARARFVDLMARRR